MVKCFILTSTYGLEVTENARSYLENLEEVNRGGLIPAPKGSLPEEERLRNSVNIYCVPDDFDFRVLKSYRDVNIWILGPGGEPHEIK